MNKERYGALGGGIGGASGAAVASITVESPLMIALVAGFGASASYMAGYLVQRVK